MDFSPKLISSLDLVHRVSRAAAAYTLARMGVLERLPGNPVGVAIRRNANVVALMARHLPSTTFNCVIGLRPGQEDQIGRWSNGIVSTGSPGCSKSPPATIIPRSHAN